MTDADNEAVRDLVNLTGEITKRVKALETEQSRLKSRLAALEKAVADADSPARRWK